MGKLIATEWISLDGYVSGPNDDVSYVGTYFNNEMQNYETEIVRNAEALLLGRVTYDSFSGSWPNVPNNPNVSEQEKLYAQMLNSMPKIAVSAKLAKAEWQNTTLINDLKPDTINRIKSDYSGNILIYGSANVIQQLTAIRLIDEYQLLIHPILLGGGKRLFLDQKSSSSLELIESKQFKSGVLFTRYALAV